MRVSDSEMLAGCNVWEPLLGKRRKGACRQNHVKRGELL
jgi:hypothetical protein